MKSNFQSLRFYDAVAPEYDEIVGDTTYAVELEPFLAPRAGSIRRVLDVGAGTGKTIEAVLELVEPDAIVAVDISDGMLEELAKKYPHVETVCDDVLDYLARDPEPFDLI
ncbi:MAG: class I SAM-dependent methyltransferase, partial [Candidatus Eremiobacteraeota bacterium]|nr:class I SAM-dependent methyltransferase [Candidatus Eremiobacteraeota bacterium]